MSNPQRSTTPASYQGFFKMHHAAVLSYYARRASRADAWDATSEVFVVALRRFDEIPADSPRAWLLGVARKVAIQPKAISQASS